MRSKIEYIVNNRSKLVEKLIMLEDRNNSQFNRESYHTWKKLAEECSNSGDITMFANGYQESLTEAQRLNNEDKQIYINALKEAEDREDLEDIVHEIFFYDKGLFVMLRHFPKDMPFEELRDKLIEIIQSTILDEGLQDTVDDFSAARATWDSYDTGVSLDDALEEYNDLYGEEGFYAKPVYNEDAWNQMKSMFMESLVRNKKLNENLMDAVLDRADGVEYNPDKFYRYLRDFGYRWYNDILRQMDNGEEEDVADAIVDSIRFLISSDDGDPDNKYAQQLYQFIRGSTWLTNDKTAEKPQYLKDIENEQNSDYDYSKDLDGISPDDELEEDYQSSDDGWGDPYTYDEVERELKKITNNWKDKDGTIRCYYGQEKEFGKQILKKYYTYVEVSDGRTGPGEEMSWVLAYARPKEELEESFDDRVVKETEDYRIVKDSLNGKKDVYSLWLQSANSREPRRWAPTTMYFDTIDEAEDYYNRKYLDESLTESRTSRLQDAIIDCLDWFIMMEMEFPKDKFLADSWEDVKDGIIMGIDPEFEVAEGIVEYFKPIVTFNDRYNKEVEEEGVFQDEIELYKTLVDEMNRYLKDNGYDDTISY